MARFTPHEAKPKARLFCDEPTLWFAPEALRRIQLYVEECSDEIGWLGMVEKYDDEQYLCNEVHLLHQDVHGATTEIQPEGLVKFAEEVGFEKNESVRLWGHSHVNMGTGASGQDEKQMDLFKNNGFDWFFRIICNKKGNISVTFFNYGANYVVDDVPWDVYYPVEIDRDAVKKEISDKVSKITYSAPKTTTYKYANDNYGYNYYGGYANYGDDGWETARNTESTTSATVSTGKSGKKNSVAKNEDDDEMDYEAILQDNYILNTLATHFTYYELCMMAEGRGEYEDHPIVKDTMKQLNVDYEYIMYVIADEYGRYV